jgi:uncharacterized membrane protein SirB2
VLQFAEWLQATRLSLALRLAEWSIPVLQSIHILMIGIVFVSVLVVALRVLGRLRTDQPLADVVARFTPWLWGGLVIMLLTGALLAIAEPIRQVMTLSFWLKMALIVVGIAGAAVFQRSVRGTARVASGREQTPLAGPSGAQKALAGGTVVLWLAIIFLGRAIGYDVELWGELSPGYGAEQ